MNNHYIIVELSQQGESINRAFVSQREDIISRFTKIRQEFFDKDSFFFIEEWNDDTIHPETSFIYFPNTGSMNALHRLIVGSDVPIHLPAKMNWDTVMFRGYIQMDYEQREAFLNMELHHSGMSVHQKFEDMIKVFAFTAKLKELTWKSIVRMPCMKYTEDFASKEARNLGYEFFLYGSTIYHITPSNYHPTPLNPEGVK